MRQFPFTIMPFKNNDLSHHDTVKHIIPPTAVEVCVHNMLNPYFISVSNIKEREKMLAVINKTLPGILKRSSDSGKYKEGEQLKPGTMVIVDRKTPDGVDLPAWYCRAIITEYNEKTSKYFVFLPDYGGDHIELSRESFITVSDDDIKQPFVIYTICLYNILPAKKIKLNNEKRIGIIVEKEWAPQTLDLTMQLLSHSTKSYFNHITTYKNGIKCGELYLIIENKTVPLREALIRAYCAVYLTDDLFNDKKTMETLALSITTDTDELSDNLSTHYDPMNSTVAKAKRNIFDEILVSSNMECERFNTMAEARLDASVLKTLDRLSITHVRRLQSYIWPAINKGLDVLAVGPRKCGKTIGYATPIASIIANTTQYQVKHHPMALVLCSSSSQVLYTQSIFQELLCNFEEIKIIGASNGCSDHILMGSILSGCHIFISTPAFLLRFFQKSEHHRAELKFGHINHLIIDNLDEILNKHSTALSQLLGRYTIAGRKNLQHTSMLALQLVATAQQWSPILGKFIEIFRNPYICIGSFADAAIFCGIQLRPRLVNQDKKKIKIGELLHDHYRMVKTMIVCANSNEADELNEYLSKNFQVLYVHEKMLITEIISMRELWQSGVPGMYQVMICIDEVLPNIKITDVSWLIHYSVAVSSKSTFLFRFSTLMRNLKKKSHKVEMTIFIDETNDLQFRGIMDMIKRSGAVISPELLHAIDRVSETLERDKKGYQICNNIKSFGYCPRSGKCIYRHCVIPDVDTPMTSLKIGYCFKFTITYVHNATHFSARIHEYIDNDNQKHEISDMEQINITSKVHHYYSDKNNRYISREIIVGGIYAYDDSFDTYHRVQVIDIVSKNPEDAPLYVNLRCIDSGILYNRVRTSKLMAIPKELADAPAYIVELFLVNLLPFDDEIEWNTRANECTHRWFTDELGTRSAYLYGKVCLHLGNTIWVSPIEVRTKIMGRRDLITGSLASHLVRQKHGIINRLHLISLKKLCIDAGVIAAEELDD